MLDISSAYGEWKSWGNELSFGKLASHHRAYFSAEIERTKLSTIANVLEIGFGNGQFLAYAREKGWSIVGTEKDPRQIQIARNLGFTAVHADDIGLFDKARFDLIVAFDVLEHIYESELAAFLTSMRNLLRPGGAFLARFPNGDSPFGLQTQYGDVTHVAVLGRGKIEYFSKESGLELAYFGPEAQPILCGSLKHSIHRVVALPIKALLEPITKAVFLPKSRIVFYAPNITVVLKKQ